MAKLSAWLPPRVKEVVHDARRSAKRLRSRLVRRLSRPNLYRLDTPERVGVVFTAPSDMRIDERLFLYSLVRGFRPDRALEIGVLQGGGGAIMANAMEDNGKGIIIGLDPAPNLRVRSADLHGRYTVITQPSPQGVPDARAAAGGPFDFVLIDGLHMHEQVRKDIDAVLPHLADGAYVLFHDAFHYGVATAIREAVESEPRLYDCGYACRTANFHDPATPYNGFRLLRFGQSPVVDVQRTVEPLYAQAGKPMPSLTEEVLDHDVWYCRAVKPCPRCAARGAPTPNGDGLGHERHAAAP